MIIDWHFVRLGNKFKEESKLGKIYFFKKQLFSKSWRTISYKLIYLNMFVEYPIEAYETCYKDNFVAPLKGNFKYRQNTKNVFFLQKSVVEKYIFSIASPLKPKSDMLPVIKENRYQIGKKREDEKKVKTFYFSWKSYLWSHENHQVTPSKQFFKSFTMFVIYFIKSHQISLCRMSIKNFGCFFWYKALHLPVLSMKLCQSQLGFQVCIQQVI